jgi:sugar transferase (PEP-CTERM/EpsH1 system associated)
MRVLFLTHRLPYAPNRGDRVRAYHIVRELVTRADVELVSFVHDPHELEQVRRLEAMGVEVTALRVPRLRNYVNSVVHLVGRRPLTHVLLDAPGVVPALGAIVERRPPDVVLAYCSGMARFALAPPLAGFPLVVDLVDVDSEKWAALASSAGWPMSWVYRREARHLAEFERDLAKKASTVLVVNERERDALARIAPNASVTVVPVGVDRDPLRSPKAPEERPRVVFCGVMDYQPNIDAVLWFTKHVWPAVRAGRPDAHLSIVGANPVSVIERLNSPTNGIEVTGTVDDVRPYLWRSAVAVAPLRTARGVQTKVLEAVGAGLPSVVTPQVFNGLPAAVRGACALAGSAEEYARATLALLALPPEERKQMAARADLHVLGWETQLSPLYDALAHAAISGRAVAASQAVAV